MFGKKSSFERPLLLLLLLVFVLIGQKEPTSIKGMVKKTATATSTLFILDNSLSMAVRDTEEGASRFQAGQQLLDLLLKSQEGDWVSLGTQNGDFEFLAPLTIDVPITRLMLNQIPFAYTGTNFLKSFQTLLKNFEEGHRPSQIVLVSDGEPIPSMTEEDRQKLMKILDDLDIPLYTIGVGSLEGGMIPDVDKKSIPDFKLLEEMAESGKGNFYRIGDTGLIDLSETIQSNFIGKKTEGSLERVVRRLSPYFYLLAALLLLFALRLNPR